MRTRHIFMAIIVLLSCCQESMTQSVFTLQYRFNINHDSTLYHAFLVRNEDGSGLMRVRYNNGKGGEDILVEAYTDETIPQDATGEYDTSLLLIRPVQARFIQADQLPDFNAPVFIFRVNPQSGYLEPAGVAPSSNPLPVMLKETTFSWKLAEGLALDRKLVGAYFNEDDSFYVNLFRPTTRGLSPEDLKTRLHLLIVADTLDKRIGKSSILDIAKVSETFGSICRFLGIRMEITMVYGKNYGKQGVLAALNKIRTATAKSKKDMVVFYYTGHGFQLPEKPSRYPNLKLKNFVVPKPAVFKTEKDSLIWVKKERDANIANCLNIEEIAKNIRSMKTRFSLIISDCCNDDIFAANIEGVKPSRTKGSGIQWDEKNLRSLFFQKIPMSVLVTATRVGQKAASKNDFGGFFTEFFKRSLESHSSKIRANVSWDMVLTQARLQTAVAVKKQYCATPKIPANLCNQEPDAELKSNF